NSRLYGSASSRVATSRAGAMTPFCLQRHPGGGVMPPAPGFRVYPCVRFVWRAAARQRLSARVRARPCRCLAFAVQPAFLCVLALGFGLGFGVGLAFEPHGSIDSACPRAMKT